MTEGVKVKMGESELSLDKRVNLSRIATLFLGGLLSLSLIAGWLAEILYGGNVDGKLVE